MRLRYVAEAWRFYPSRLFTSRINSRSWERWVFAALVNSPVTRGRPVLLPPCMRQRPLVMAALRQGSPVVRAWAPQRLCMGKVIFFLRWGGDGPDQMPPCPRLSQIHARSSCVAHPCCAASSGSSGQFERSASPVVTDSASSRC